MEVLLFAEVYRRHITAFRQDEKSEGNSTRKRKPAPHLRSSLYGDPASLPAPQTQGRALLQQRWLE